MICTYAIAHIRDYKRAISELKCVAKMYIVISMPCQREYKYTVDLHVNFCPYLYRFQEFTGGGKTLSILSWAEIGCVFIDKMAELENL